MTSEQKLLACPFCGGEAERALNPFHNDMSMAQCRQCGASAFWKKWNGRVAALRASAEPSASVWAASDDEMSLRLQKVAKVIDPLSFGDWSVPPRGLETAGSDIVAAEQRRRQNKALKTARSVLEVVSADPSCTEPQAADALSATPSPLMQAAGKAAETDSELTSDFAKALPGGMIDDSTYSAIEDALDAIDAPMTEGTRYMTLVERIMALRAAAGKAAPQSSAESGPVGYLLAKAGVDNGHYFIDPSEYNGFEPRDRYRLKPVYTHPAPTDPQPSRIDAAAEPTREEIARQTVETIPRDGRRLILFWDDSDDIPTHFELGWWRDGSWRNTYGHPFSGEPTHWFDPLALSKPRGEPAREGGESPAKPQGE